jgi:hypothetical protein
VQEVKAVAPIHEGFFELGPPDQQIDFEGKPSMLGDTVWVVCLIKSDWGLGPAKILRGSRAHGVNRPSCKLELMTKLVCGRPTVDRHDYLFFRERGCHLS